MPRTHVLALLLVASGLPACALPQLDVQPRYGLLALDGEVGASSTGITGRADLEEAGLDDDEGAPGLRADFKWGAPHLILMGGQTGFDGRGMLTADIELDGVTIPAGTTVDSELDLTQYTGLIVFDLVPGKTFELGLGFGATLIDFDFDVQDVGTMARVTSDESVPIPLLAANAGIHFFSLEGTLLISGMSASYDDYDGTYLDIDASLRWHLLGGKNHLRSSLMFGWRQTEVDVEYEDGSDDVEADFTLSGPYVGLEITL
jgi:hypothetical protein